MLLPPFQNKDSKYKVSKGKRVQFIEYLTKQVMIICNIIDLKHWVRKPFPILFKGEV